jgi:hypothetical protein
MSVVPTNGRAIRSDVSWRGSFLLRAVNRALYKCDRRGRRAGHTTSAYSGALTAPLPPAPSFYPATQGVRRTWRQAYDGGRIRR